MEYATLEILYLPSPIIELLTIGFLPTPGWHNRVRIASGVVVLVINDCWSKIGDNTGELIMNAHILERSGHPLLWQNNSSRVPYN
jgi:hypothetical protein